jgi:hypothetical protein
LVQLVDRDVVDQVTGLCVVLRDGAVLVAGDDVLAQVAPAGDGGLALIAHYGENLLIGLLCLHVDLDVQHNNSAQVPHALLCYAQQLGAVLVELDALDGRREVPCLQALPRLDVPEPDRIVGGPRGEDGGGWVDVDGPDGTLVAAVRPQPFAVVRKPDADLLILGNREDKIAVGVVSARHEHRLDGKLRISEHRGRPT